jgi:hypothetical protein
MNKQKLTEVLKPIIKECISEMLLEEGLLTKVVQQISEGIDKPQPAKEKKELSEQKSLPKVERKKMKEVREKMLESMGSDKFNGVNVFEGTTPTPAAKSPQASAGNALSDVDPKDKGVDISSFANPNWRKLV